MNNNASHLLWLESLLQGASPYFLVTLFRDFRERLKWHRYCHWYEFMENFENQNCERNKKQSNAEQDEVLKVSKINSLDLGMIVVYLFG